MRNFTATAAPLAFAITTALATTLAEAQETTDCLAEWDNLQGAMTSYEGAVQAFNDAFGPLAKKTTEVVKADPNAPLAEHALEYMKASLLGIDAEIEYHEMYKVLIAYTDCLEDLLTTITNRELACHRMQQASLLETRRIILELQKDDQCAAIMATLRYTPGTVNDGSTQ